MSSEDILDIGQDISKKKKRSFGRQGSRTGLHFFAFPKSNPEKRGWCSLIKRIDGMDGFKVSSSTFLCEKHFTSADIKQNPNYWQVVPGAVPSLNLVAGTVPSTGGKCKARKPPSARFEIFPSSSQDTSSQFSSFGSEIDAELGSPFEEHLSTSTVSISTQTDFSFVNSPTYLPIDFEKMENDIMDSFIKSDTLQSQSQELSAKVIELENQVEQLELQLAQVKLSLFSIEKLKSDSSATRFFTGFPNFPTLMSTFEYFEPKVQQMHCNWCGNKSSQSSDDYHTKSSRGPKRPLTHLEEFILVLMRLKVGLFIDDLAGRFGISSSQVSKIFTTWICFLYHELPLLFKPPSQEVVRQAMLAQFKDFPTTRLIIHCTEIFAEVPSSMKAQSQTWSEYKHHNTWKVLIGISPSGLITFVSKLWSGKVSDKEITLKSGVLALFEDGDNLMADRGFDVKDIPPPGVTLNIPPFKGTQAQLTANKTEETDRIASVRIHVERAIGRVKNYHILDGVLPLSLHSTANQIFTVCCLLTNFLPI
ncbi:uncharacterized protein LOC135683491 [Rhopilema esculentum]|uniref:uncharacterized protein LOC135683491 n=1 Tax=Rhopilema esculentum TaxID=499914 RepID=UPI0031DD0F67